ncbi:MULTISPECIES: hypothetical protein [unclassified Streptomyces]|jgi:hypothetical protein|uniref:hypothetical protein n=1 Tax=unclassified Streptomyces TaxID=2593676 RepID=UPI000FFEAEBF|nr:MULTISPECIES: hypothetical protein [unclassified Streptomyces]
MPAIDAQDLAARYIGLWNEPDPETRRKTVHALWAEDGQHILLPPQQMHDQAVGLGFTSAALEARGHDELHARVTRAYEEFVAPGTYEFRIQEAPRQLRDVITFRWESFHREEGQVTGGGRDFLVLDDTGRIRFDYQFPD